MAQMSTKIVLSLSLSGLSIAVLAFLIGPVASEMWGTQNDLMLLGDEEAQRLPGYG